MIGSGYIGMECGGFLNGFGKKVHIMYRSKVLKSFDDDVTKRIVEYMEGVGINFFKGSPLSFSKLDGKVIVKYKDGEG